MKHRLFNCAALLSLLLCLACVGMWVRSGSKNTVYKEEVGRTIVLHSARGAFWFESWTETPPLHYLPPRAWGWEREGARGWCFGGDRCWPAYRRYTRATPTGILAGSGVYLPYWVLTLATAGLPVFRWWRQWRQAKRLARRGFAVETPQ